MHNIISLTAGAARDITQVKILNTSKDINLVEIAKLKKCLFVLTNNADSVSFGDLVAYVTAFRTIANAPHRRCKLHH